MSKDSLFGTDGIRGRVNEYPMTADMSLRVGKAVATVLNQGGEQRPRVVLGKDTRVSGYMIETALTSGLVSMGMDVLLVGPMPTPAVAHLTKSMACTAGIMITASHNPYTDNGVKIFGHDGYKLSDELEEQIESHVLSDEQRPGLAPEKIGKAFRIDDARGRYIEFVKQTADNIALHGLKVVVDCGHGAAYDIAPMIFRELGAKVIECGVDPDGYNINKDCGALYPEAAAKLVLEHKADLGISFDGDADRVIFSGADGRVIHGDRVLALCAIGLKNRGELAGNAMAVTIMSNLGMIEAMRREGIEVETTAVGDRNVIECLRSRDFVFGGENSGHLVFSRYSTTGDGLMSALQVLRLMKESGKGLAELAAVMEEYPAQLINLPVASKPPLDEINGLAELIKQAESEFGQQGRQLIRYSGTENKIRILVEHKDGATCRSWAEKFKELISKEIG